MKKSLVILISLSLIVLLSMSIVSASWFGDIWKKITGSTTHENQTTGCTNECSSSGVKQCSGGGYQTCGEYDSDSCLEWSSVTSCSSSEICTAGNCVSNTYTCTDSDGGKDYNVKGNVIAKSPISDINVIDLCSDPTRIVEYFCNPDKTQSGETYTCPNGCSNGACASLSTTTNQTNITTTTPTGVWCTDSDGGKNYNTKGNTLSGPVGSSTATGNTNDYCGSGNSVVEYFCGSNIVSGITYNTIHGELSPPCPNGCSNGACISSTSGTTNVSNITTPTLTTIATSPTTTSTSVSGGGSSGSGSTSSSIKFETPAGFFEETTNIEEKIEGEIKITTETKKVTDERGNEIKIEVKTEIKKDGTTIIEEKREFTNKEGKLIKLKFTFENDGENIKIKREVEVEDRKIESELEIEEKFEENEIKLKARLSDGSEQEIKIMPDRASEIAIEKLKNNNFEIELKEVGEGNNLKAVYVAKVDENGRLLGLFKVRLKSEAQIDSETGEILNLEKQWWNFLVAKIPTPQKLSISNNQTNLTNITLPGNQTGNFSFNRTGNNATNITNITLPLPINQTNITLPKNQTNLTAIPTNLTNFTINNNTNINITVSCTDSDGGKNYNVTGNTASISSSGVPGNVNDYCSGSYVVEYYCQNTFAGSVIGGETHSCPNGCSNGACI